MKGQASLDWAQQRALQCIEDHSSEYILGVDEVGVGSWAGPVTVAGCVFPSGWKNPAVKDSKQLTPLRRHEARKVVLQEALMSVVLEAPNTVIDEYGMQEVHAWLTEGVIFYCLRRYPSALVVQDGETPVAVEGNPPMIWLAKADVYVPSVSAASVLAKEHRDAFMREQHGAYPSYGFRTNMGYGTPQHQVGLHRVGVCPLHRMSYKPVAAAERAYRKRYGT